MVYVTEEADEKEEEQPPQSSIFFMTNDDENNGIDPVLENQRVILENQSKIMQALAKIQTGQDYAMTHCHCRTQRLDGSSTKQQVQPAFSAVDSVDDLKALEKSLEDSTKMQTFLSGMSFICGTTGKAQGVDCCYKLIDYFFTRMFLTQCSWTGMVRKSDGNTQQEPSTSADAEPKIPLKFYGNTRRLFVNLVRQADKDFSELDGEKFFKTILKNSKQRLSAKMLTSKHKNRPTNLKYKKTSVEPEPVQADARDDARADAIIEEEDVSNVNTTGSFEMNKE